MVKSIFRPKKPQLGAFLLILASPLVISGGFIFRSKIKNRSQKILSGCNSNNLRIHPTFD
ncbi:hypothetical protein BS333_04025 [Vibrio azureus]|nr:hypothetical protein BS333_04025 [Vibrio azureus]